jgi:hypothetical protein
MRATPNAMPVRTSAVGVGDVALKACHHLTATGVGLSLGTSPGTYRARVGCQRARSVRHSRIPRRSLEPPTCCDRCQADVGLRASLGLQWLGLRLAI